MQPNQAFLNRDNEFWAFIRYASEKLGYSDRSKKSLKTYSLQDLKNLSIETKTRPDTTLSAYEYMNYRSHLLETSIKDLFMDREEAKTLYERLCKEYEPSCHLPLNKQKNEKKHNAYYSCIINIITEYHLNGQKFEDNPGKLTTIYNDEGRLVATLSRRIDGAYPSLKNPSALWEIKEYYGTTTFGSRVADGVYETQLDGFEIDIASKITNKDIAHYLFIDDRFTWWDKGRSYLCRLIDATHMKLVDEVIFGKEVLHRWPIIVSKWISPSQ